MTDISIIILTLNSKEFIVSSLDSVFNQTRKAREVIVVDNGSKDGTPEFIKEKYPEVILVRNEENVGAARARNQGIEVSAGEWILTLDCDVILGKGFLHKAIQSLKNTEESLGMLQPKILSGNGEKIYSCGIYLSRLKRFYDIGKGRTDNGKFNNHGYIFGACSAAAFYKRKMLEEVKEETGYFDERFFFLVEDVDLALRAKNRGWKTLFCPEAVCYHSGDSSHTSIKLRQYLCWRNRKLLLSKLRMNRLERLAISLCYDFPRRALLYAINPYVRYQIRHKRNDVAKEKLQMLLAG